MKANKLLAVSKVSLAVVILFLVLSGLKANGQKLNQMDNNTVAVRLACYKVKPEVQDVFRKAISDYILYSAGLETNILSEAYYEEDKPSILWIIERWDNKTALEKVSGSAQYKAINSLCKTGLIQPAEVFYVKDLEPLSKQQWRTPAKKEDKPITIMLFVDSKAGTENHFKDVYHTAMPQFRSEPGVITYQLSQLADDSTRFVTYEKFRNDDAFQYHLNFPPIKPVIDYLNTSIKKQPFQIGLHRLIVFAPSSNK